ncbi:uncharacterized protein LOC123921864 [Trifolium pratense]|uniref:uncharacterized protein LOC123921864 n=1 Tax=Trifolium pratense TaxID=57577 RepID=UPI001E692B9E|nr:uncharacterized protein LOC123921864 [Trifolium pratense]
MANQEKQYKKGFMYIYKIGTGNQRKKELEEHGVVEKEKKLSSSRSWLQRIRNPMSRSYNHNHKELNINGGFVEARNSTSCLELETRGGYIEGRNSVSCIEASSSPAITRGIIVEEGRKSVSYVETKLAAEEKLGKFVEARKSVSQIETLSSVIEYLQVKVLVSDMPSFMQVNAFRCARNTYDSLEEFSSKHIAHNIKKEFDKAYGPVWHCIVGPSFGSFVTHSTGCFLYFSMENLYILLFKTKVKKASV